MAGSNIHPLMRPIAMPLSDEDILSIDVEKIEREARFKRAFMADAPYSFEEYMPAKWFWPMLLRHKNRSDRYNVFFFLLANHMLMPDAAKWATVEDVVVRNGRLVVIVDMREKVRKHRSELIKQAYDRKLFLGKKRVYSINHGKAVLF